MSHTITHVILRLCKELGLPDWAALFVIVPFLLFVAIGTVFVRWKHFKILKRKIAPYNGTLRHGLFFWAPTAFFEVDGIPGELPWCSLLGVTRIRFERLMSAGRLLTDNCPISDRARRAFRGESIPAADKLFSLRFQAIGAPGSFAAAVLDEDTRRRLMALLEMSRIALGRGRVADYFYSASNPKGRVRLEIDGKTMTLSLKAHLGTRETEELLAHAAAICRRVRRVSDPAAAAR